MADTESAADKELIASRTRTSMKDSNEKTDRSSKVGSEPAKKGYKAPHVPFKRNPPPDKAPPKKKRESIKTANPKLGRVITPSMLQEWDQIINKDKKAATCPGCKVKMKRLTSLQDHVGICEKAGPKFSHACKECNVGFLTKAMLADHQNVKHGKETPVPSTSVAEVSTPREGRGARVKKPVNRDIPEYPSRSRVHKDKETNPTSPSATKSTPRPVGRPKKSPGKDGAVTDAGSPTKPLQRFVGRTKKSLSQDSSATDDDISSKRTHKTQSKPKKSSASASETGASPSRTGVQTRGKRVKHYAEPEDDEIDGDWSPRGIKGVTHSGRRGRGRGRGKEVKTTSDSEDDIDESGDKAASSESAAKPGGRRSRRQGRNKASVVDQTKESSESKVKGKDDSQQESSKVSKRKRRSDVLQQEAPPPKKKDTKSGGDDDSSEIPESKKPSSLPLADQKKFAKEILQWEKDFKESGYLFAKCPRCHLRRRAMESLVAHYRKCIAQKPDVCEKCGREFQSTAGLKYHMMAEHHSVGDSSGNDKASLAVLLRKTGRLKCQNEGCNKKFSSSAGYRAHRARCGIHRTYECEECNKTYTTKEGLKYHVRVVHPVEEELDPEPEPEPEPKKDDTIEFTSSGRAKRRAASRALKTLKDITLKAQSVVTEKKRRKEIKTLYVIPEALNKLEGEWRKTVQKEGQVKCPFDGCIRVFTAPSKMKVHYQLCKLKPESCKLDFCCKVCDKVMSSVITITNHIKQKHEEELDEVALRGDDDNEGDSSSESDYEGSEEEDEDEDDDENMEEEQLEEDNEEIEEDDEQETNELTEQQKPKRRGATPGHLGDPQTGFLKTMKDAIQWTTQQRRERFCSPGESIFQNLKSSMSDWHLLEDREREDYEPVTKQSVPVRVENLPAKVDKTFHKLNRYSVFPNKSNRDNQRTWSTFFVGGPVWAMAWCPVPQGQYKANQYAAISCHRKMDETHKINLTHKKPGMVQLWDFGQLTNTGANSLPQFSMGLAHDYGCVWDLKWCPSGCWEDPGQSSSSTEEAGQSSEVRGDTRLGLLGMACSDGTVRVLCVPHPKATDDANKATPIYKPIPALSLFPCVQHGKDSVPWFGQCWCLEWLPKKKHTQIVASFSNGSVVLWDLSTTSSLLQTTSATDGRVIYPIQAYSLCDYMIRSLTWCVLDPNYLAVVCRDKSLSIWDLRDTSFPVMKHSTSLHIDCKWLSHWAGFLASVDSSLVQARAYSMVAYYECGYYGFSLFPTTLHKGCVWSLDVSDWLNGVVSVDAGGDAEIMLLLPLCYDMEWVKAHHMEDRRRSLYFTELEKLSMHDKQKVISEKNNDGSKQSQTSEIRDPLSNKHDHCAAPSAVGTSQVSVSPGRHDRKDSSKRKSTNNSTSNDLSPEKRTDKEQIGAAIEVDLVTTESDSMMDVAVETQVGEDGVSVETNRTEEVHDRNGNVPTGDVELVQDNTLPIVIKTEPIDPDEYITAEGTNLGDAVVGPSHDSQSEGNNTSNVLDRERTAPTVETVEENNGVEFQDEIAQLLQVCQEVQESLTDPEEPATPGTTSQNSAIVNERNKSPNKGGKTGRQGKAGKNKKVVGKSKVGSKNQGIGRLPRNYQEMADDYGIVYHDIDMSHFSNSYKLGWRMRSLPRLKYARGMKEPQPDQFPLQALHKISWNPNYGSHFWVLTAGQAGIVRAHCMVGLKINPPKGKQASSL